MSDPLNLFPARIPIGRWRDPTTQRDVPVLMSDEFERALSALLNRVGGPEGTGTADLEVLAMQSTAPEANFAQVAELEAARASELLAPIVELGKLVQEALVQLAASEARAAETAKALQDLQVTAGYSDPFRVNWERPGAIGSLTPSSGAFTTLTASAAVTLNPANANVVISPTGTGVVTIAPGTAGSINRMNIGATVPGTGAFTTLISSLGFGCNGKSAQSSVALGAAATDLASVINLANLMRAALINNGIGS